MRKITIKKGARYEKETPVFSIITSGVPEVRLCMVLSMVEHEWSCIVGELLASRSRPVAFENGVLVISAHNQAAMSDLNFKSSFIKREIEKKALLKLKGVRVEINRSAKRRPIQEAVSKKMQNRSLNINPKLQNDLKDDILTKYDGIDPELALCIARCRIMSSEKR